MTNGQVELVLNEVKPIRPVPFSPPRSRQDWKHFLEKLYAGWGDQWESPSQ